MARASKQTDLEEVLRLVDLIYAAATSPQEWPVFLERLRGLTNSAIVSLQVEDASSHHAVVPWQVGADPAVVKDLPEYAPDNIFMKRALPRIRTGDVVFGERQVSPEELRKNRFVNEYMVRLGTFHHLGAFLFKESGYHGVLTVNRAIGLDPHSDADFRLVRALTPHLQRALLINRHTQGISLERDASTSALDRLTMGVAFFDRDGCVSHLNRSAREILDESDGLKLDRDGHLVAADRRAARALRAAIAATCRRLAPAELQQGGLLRIRRPTGKRALTVLLVPTRTELPQIMPTGPAGIGLIADPEKTPGGISGSLQRLYQLTPAEARVAEQVLAGRRTDEIAGTLGITENTVRTHLKRTFGKAEVRNQAELVAVLLRGPAGLRHDTHRD